MPDPPFDAAKLSAHVKVLASDEFEGRGPASEGETKTIAYLSAQFAALGLEPAGDHGSWTQQVPLRKFEQATPARVHFKFNDSISVSKAGDQIVVVSLAGKASVQIKDAPLVFVGYGVTAPELAWDDFKGIDLKGKGVFFLINDPDFESAAPGRFGGNAMTYYGRWSYKFEEAARRGAAAALIVHEDAPASYGWTTVLNSWAVPQFDIVRAEPGRSHPLLEGWLRRDVAARLFKKAGLDFDELKRRAMRPDFTPIALKGVRLSVQARVSTTQVLSHNVIAKLVGRTRPQESVVYGAHWDHLGVGQPDRTGDRIYHGAVDNAIGVAGLLELARVFASQPRTARSIYFVAFTGEEKGLLGSQYFALHPPTSLERMAAIFNMDIFGTAGPACDPSIRGTPNSSLHQALAAAAQSQGRIVSPDLHPEAGYFYRADHFPLAKVGVPGVSILPGLDLIEGGVAAGQKAYEDYMQHRYHQPADRWSADWDLRGTALDLEVLYKAGRAVAESSLWPLWYEGSQFKRIRDQTAALRTP